MMERQNQSIIEPGDYGWIPPDGDYGTVREVRDDGMVVFGVGIFREPLIVKPEEIEVLAPARGSADKQRDQAFALLRRLSEWDHMQTAGDGPYWRAEIAKVLDPASTTEASP